MAEMGYVLSSEEMTPNEMVRNARRAEEAGFTTAWISDHYHPGSTRRARAHSCGA